MNSPEKKQNQFSEEIHLSQNRRSQTIIGKVKRALIRIHREHSSRIRKVAHFIGALISLRKYFEENFYVDSGKNVKDDAAKIRHIVFCEEKHWESEQKDHLEQDEYDDYSVPIVLYKRNICLYEPAACLRLILRYRGPLPIEKNIHITHDRISTAEVSRLAIDPKYRKKHVDISK